MGFFDDDAPNPNEELSNWLEEVRERLRDDERRAFDEMARRSSSLTEKQAAWVDRVREELAQNVDDRRLLIEAIDEATRDEAREAFEEMIERIGTRGTLTVKQRDWARRVAGWD